MGLAYRPLVLAVLGPLAFLAAACGGPGSDDLNDLTQVIEELQEGFIDKEKLTTKELVQAAIHGVIEYLDDPYTSYLTPEQYKNFGQSLSGENEEFEGIGAEVSTRDGQLMILGPLPGSPARKAGIRPGDLVLEVDGVPIVGYELLDAVNLIRGERGTPVVLRILRVGAPLPIDITIIRDTIELTSVSARILEDGIGYVGLAAFDSGTGDGLREAIATLRSDGVDSLIVDLRNNTGGLVEAVMDVASEFIQEDLVIFRWQNADGSEERFKTNDGGIAHEMPLVLIVNGFSASASEILMGALQDHDRALVVGTRTFGKGSVNLLHELDSGAGLYVTTARWLTPNGKLIEGHGLDPDVLVGGTFDVHAAQRVGSLTQALCQAYDEERDNISAQERFVKAVSDLCGLGSVEPLPDIIDEQLETAINELRKMMDN